MPPVFSNTEVLDLCDSIKDIHRALISLGELFGRLEDDRTLNDGVLISDFMRWGLKKISENFLSEQHRKLNRIIELYREDEECLDIKRQGF